ncbi:Abortive infection bacteriophage resistance protein [uncultured Thiomicrorhabdus sp.]
MREVYCKEALSFEQQLDLLKKRGMVFEDDSTALSCLSSINYYRLSSYWFPFRMAGRSGGRTHQFVDGTLFNDVLSLYEFDRKLRALVLNGLERIEVAVRTQITYHMAHTYGPFGHTVAGNFHPKFNHASWLSKLENETNRSSDEFLTHYKDKYCDFPKIPIWMLTEVMSFGALSYFFAGLHNNQKVGKQDKAAISSRFNLHHKRLGDWLHKLTYVRNVCAHHSRLWNRELAIRPDKVKDTLWLPPITPRNDRIFYILLMMRYLLRSVEDGEDWVLDMNQLLSPMCETEFYRVSMGAPVDWQNHPLWT